MEKSKISKMFARSSGGVLITNICPALILILFWTFLIEPFSDTIPRISVSSPACVLNAYKVMPIEELFSFTSTSNKYPLRSIKCSVEGISFLKKINLFPIKAMKRTQIIVTTRPTYEKSKKLNPEFDIDALYSDIIIFGGVPIAVFIPPKIQAKAKGIRYLEGCHSIF